MRNEARVGEYGSRMRRQDQDADGPKVRRVIQGKLGVSDDVVEIRLALFTLG